MDRMRHDITRQQLRIYVSNGGIMKKGLMIVVGIFLLSGCLPGIMITQKEPSAQGSTVEYRLGNQVEVGEWVALQKQVCSDLEYATETLPEDVRKDIYKYSCVEPNLYRETR
jgi:hypothetical protein